MLATVIVLILIVAGIAYFYMKCNIVTSLTNTLAALFGSILAFSYYEQLAGLLASEVWAVTWIQSAAFLLIFFFGFLFIRVLSGFLVKSGFDVSHMAKLVVTLICGLLTGLIVSGVLLVAVALSPLPPSSFYSRYPVSQPIHPDIDNTPIINADGFVTSVYSWISRGSLSSRKSFAVLHADYLAQVHLDRYPLGQNIPAVCSPKAIKLPIGNVQPVRLFDFPDRQRMTVVHLGISGNAVAIGGAATSKSGAFDRGEVISFIPAQIRLITKPQDQADNNTGSGEVVYPVGILHNGNLEAISLNQEMKEEVANLGPERYWWLDLVFQVPSGQRAVLLSFKQNAIIELPKAVQTNEDIEKALNVN